MVVILARDEAEALRRSLPSVAAGLEAGDRVEVVADHCQDDTAAVARRGGARVLERAAARARGKGPALRWWLARTRSSAETGQIVVVLDADSRIPPGFARALRRRFETGARVVQTRVEPEVASASPVARLAAISEIAEQRGADALRARLGWPVRLRGTGMAFRRETLEAVAGSLRTSVEDAELTILLAAQGVPITRAAETWVTDPKPADRGAAIRQRARWLRGQIEVARAYPGAILRLARRGPPGWSLLGSVLAKPRTLLVPLKVGLAFGAWRLAALGGSPLAHGAAWALSACLALEAAVMLVGLAQIPRKSALLLALSPLYLAVWLTSAAMAVVSGGAWLRSRPVGPAGRALSEAPGGS